MSRAALSSPCSRLLDRLTPAATHPVVVGFSEVELRVRRVVVRLLVLQQPGTPAR